MLQFFCSSVWDLSSNPPGGDARRLLTQTVRRDAIKVKQTKHSDGAKPFQTRLLCVRIHSEPNLFVLALIATPGA